MPKGTGAQIDKEVLQHEQGSTTILREEDLSVPGQPVGQDVGSLVVYDDGADVCVDFAPGGGPAQNLACVARALLGPADGLVERGETEILVVGEVPATVSIIVGYRHADARLFRAVGLLGDEVEAWSPFAPGDESWFLSNGDSVDFFVTVTVYQDGSLVDSRTVSVPYLGQVLAAIGKTTGIP